MARRTLNRPDHPPFPTSADDVMYIHTYCALKNDAAACRLKALFAAALRRSCFAETPTSQALWQGYAALESQAEADYQDARRAGELLFAWHGTKATEVSPCA